MGRGSQPRSILQQLESVAASVTRGVSASASAALRWTPEMRISWASAAFRWPEIDFSVIESVIWPVVMAVETVALASVICFYLAFCGCNL
ncbi:hypothetical protein KFK09_012191 [Dendrobium nobile]|uniref:Uncharacterized protein n=1 Tax=Dendrobium nobile TaxID=94219 RepID=A0A8T3BI59_DENNO|nr:hypothetical protein KFK09_012191 [Dendrobium nobile]